MEENLKPIKTLYCSCCGGCLQGRQWSNQDIGYGMCECCLTRSIENRYTKEEIEFNWGKYGIHHSIEANLNNKQGS